MKEIFLHILNNLASYKNLQRANFYDDKFATIEFDDDGKHFKINISCEELEEEEKDA